MVTQNSKPLAVHRLEKADDPRFDALVGIYSAAHPRSERKPASQLATMILRPEYLFLAVTQREAVVGFAIVICLELSGACLLEYMAIAANKQDRGIGRFLFEHLVEQPEVEERFLLAEVDSDKVPSTDSLDRARRKRFYRRLGCREIEGLEYIMPPVSNAVPPAMDILAYRRDLPSAVCKDLMREWLEDIYVNVYARPLDDPRIDKMLENLPGNARLI